jgi:hypothetical protein
MKKPQVKLLIHDQEVALIKWLNLQGARITPCALILPEDIDFDTWAAMGPKLGKLKRFSTWAVADWLATGEIVFNESYSQACDSTGLDPAYLMILKHVASKVSPERRRESLSFTHHRLVAQLSASEQDKFLDLAERNCWSREVLTEAVRRYQAGLEAPQSNEPEIERVFYREGTKDHGSLIVDRDGDPLDEFNVQKIISKILELLEPASELEIRQVLAAISRRYLPVRRIEVEVQ